MNVLLRFCRWILVAAVVVGATGCPGDRVTTFQAEQYLVGAHYYLWYPANFSQGCLRRVLDPPQEPALGFYSSRDVRVVEQHISWCSRYGIDFLTLDWWPGRSKQNSAIAESFLKARNIDDIKFCVFYETWGLGFDSDLGTLNIDRERTRKLVKDLLEVADSFFSHPSYLHVTGRPVIVLYLSRTFSGDFLRGMQDLRQAMASEGYDPFIIADEVFWRVSPVVMPGMKPFPLTPEPQPKRINCFDAITSYNMYESEQKGHRGYGAQSTHLKDVAAKYEEYIAAADSKVCFIPQVMPGYNDRGVRRRSDHFPIPRQWAPGGREGSFLARSFDELAFRFVDPRLNVMMVTSWNEWNEDTGIEPLAVAPATVRDTSESGDLFTQGYSYSGHGTRFLEVIRDKVVAISGRVIAADGSPVHRAAVSGFNDDTVTVDMTDTNGYYCLSRLKLQSGSCRVGVRGAKEMQTVLLARTGTVMGVDFVLAPPVKSSR